MAYSRVCSNFNSVVLNWVDISRSLALSIVTLDH